MSGAYSAYHCHSTYSTLDGLGQLDDYFQRAEQLGLPSLSVSDHGNLHHVIDAYETAKNYNVKYIAGEELYFARKTRHHRDDEERAGRATDDLEQRGPLHLSALARNQTGFKNLMGLSSDTFLEGFFVKPRADYALLARHAEGLTLLTGCLNGPVCQALLRDDRHEAVAAASRLQDIVGKDNCFVEVMRHGLAEEEQVFPHLVEIAKHIGAKIIPTIDSHYVHQHESLSHDVSLCIGTGALVSDEKRFKFHNDQFYLKSYEEMATLFPEEWLKNSLDLNEMIEELDFELREFHFPIFAHDGDHYQYLRELTYQGIARRYGGLTPELEERVEYELGVIQRMGFVDYMLIVWDIIEWCHSNGILANARGSASGAVVSYCLGITNVEPIFYNLLFERFLIEGRVTMPDIDVDVAEDRREDVINYIKSRYGYDRVANICSFSTIGSKAAIRDSARVLGYEYKVGDTLSKMVPNAVQGFAFSLKESLSESADLKNAYQTDPVAKEVLDAAMGIEGQVRQTGIHAAGILVTPGPLSDYCPVMQKPDKEGNRGPIVTQWNGTQVESQGLLKIDVLGLRNFMILDRATKNIEKTQGITIHPEDIPDGDVDTYRTLQAGHTSSVFQMSSSGITQLVQDVRPDRLEDIAAINALYRPGPLGSGMDKTFVARKHGYAAAQYPHPSLEGVFKDTLGLMIYQENILQIAEVLAGYDAAERDTLRKLVGKKKKDQIPKARGEFVRRCVEHSGISDSLAEHTFDEIEYFGSYGFNRCVFGGTTFIDRPSGHQHPRLSVQQMYNRLHSLLPQSHPHEGPCVACGDHDEKGEYVRGQCRECKAWRHNFLYQGVHGLSIDEETGRIHPNRIQDIVFQGMRECFRITCANGMQLDVTANHRSFTDMGWLRTDEMKEGTTLVVDGGYESPTGRASALSQIVSIETLGEQETYDVEMAAPHHNFLANGIVTHNSHAFAYAYLAYQTAYFKTHYPTEYMAAVLSSIGDVESLGAYVGECERMGIDVLSPSINSSEREFTVVGDNAIQYGLRSINGIGVAALDRILSGQRGYRNIYDWIRRIDPEVLNKALIEHLINSGALDELIEDQPEKPMRRDDKMELLNAEYKELGAFLTENPLDGVWTFLQPNVTHTVDALADCSSRTKVTLAGLVIRSEHKMSKQGNPMTFVQLQDPTGTIEVSAFGPSALALRDRGPVGTIIYVTGRLDKEQLEDDNFRMRLFFYELDIPVLPEHAMGAPIVLSFVAQPDDDIIEKIISIVNDNPGDRFVIFSFPEGKQTLTFKLNKPTSGIVEERLKLVTLGQAVREVNTYEH